MEILFEFVFSLVFEGSLEIFTDKKVGTPIRIVAAIIFLLIWGGIIIALLLAGLSAMNDNLAAGILFILVDFFMFFGMIYAVIKKYKEYNTK